VLGIIWEKGILCLYLEVLLEVHDPKELDYLKVGIPDMLGVNNRHLGTFHTDVEVSFRIAALMQEKIDLLRQAGRKEEDLPVLVSESGISNPETVKRLREVGFRGFLIGECFMKEEDPGLALKNFINALEG
jgi:indole-3-glycerol phosphate synthase